MAKNSNNDMMAFAIDGGNGEFAGMSSQLKADTVVRFAPVLAPASTKRGLNDDQKPRFTLREGNQLYVVGVEDVFGYGQRNAARRLNAMERYTNEDYLRMMKVMLLHLFAAHRGEGGYIKPYGVLSLPVSQFNNTAVREAYLEALLGKHTIVDQDGCELRIELDAKRVVLVPESYGILMNYVYEPRTFKVRGEGDGTVLVIDLGHETCNVSLYEDQRLIADRAQCIHRAGMGIVARAIHEYALKHIRAADASRVDLALRALAGARPGATKQIEVTPGVMLDVTEIYDAGVADLAARLAQEILTLYPEGFTKVVLAGGGAYHLEIALREHLEGWLMVRVQEPELANVRGMYTALQQKLAKR